MNVRVLEQLDAADKAAVDALVARCEAADDHPALSEDLRDPSGGIDLHLGDGRAVLAGADGSDGSDGASEGGLCGVATVTPGADGTSAVHVAVDPGLRRDGGGAGDGGDGSADGDLRSILIGAAVDQTVGPVRLWIMQAASDDDAIAASFGLRPERDLLQMRVALPLPTDVVAATRPIETRAFEPGRDDDAWLSVNNRAFAGHPEQGHWTREQLHERESLPWFDPAGFLVAPDPGPDGDGHGLLGSCWTKVHRQRTPVLGEIYVISVDPSRHGQGWGRALTVAGLQWLAAQGLTVGMLYTDAANSAAVALYRHLGFTVDHIDRSYLGPGRSLS